MSDRQHHQRRTQQRPPAPTGKADRERDHARVERQQRQQVARLLEVAGARRLHHLAVGLHADLHAQAHDRQRVDAQLPHAARKRAAAAHQLPRRERADAHDHAERHEIQRPRKDVVEPAEPAHQALEPGGPEGEVGKLMVHPQRGQEQLPDVTHLVAEIEVRHHARRGRHRADSTRDQPAPPRQAIEQHVAQQRQHAQSQRPRRPAQRLAAQRRPARWRPCAPQAEREREDGAREHAQQRQLRHHADARERPQQGAVGGRQSAAEHARDRPQQPGGTEIQQVVVVDAAGHEGEQRLQRGHQRTGAPRPWRARQQLHQKQVDEQHRDRAHKG